MILDMLSVVRLARKLALNEVSNDNAMIFLIIGNILYILFAFIAAYILGFSYLRYETAMAEAIIAALIVIFGVRFCYRQYSGSDFMQAYIVLSVPALIYSTILSWATHWGLRFVVKKYGESTTYPTVEAVDASIAAASRVLEVGSVAAIAAGSLTFFYILAVGLKRAS